MNITIIFHRAQVNTKPAIKKRADSPRPQTPLGHFRNDIPAIDTIFEIVYLDANEQRELEKNTVKYQDERIMKRLNSPTSRSRLNTASYSIEDFIRLMFKADVSASPSNTHFYTPISDADDERVGLEID